MNEPKKIVITGASGFVAKNIRKFLSLNHYKLISIARNNFKKYKNEEKIILEKYDDPSLLNKIKNVDVLIHLVGTGKQSVDSDFESINVGLTKHFVNLSKKTKIKKFIYFSGLGVSSTTPLGYFISKYKAEILIQNSGLNYTIFRPSYIIGKDDLFTKYLKKQIQNSSIEIPGSGKFLIQPIHINDVEQIVLESILEKKFDNQIFDLVGPEKISFKDYVRLFSKNSDVLVKKINLEDAFHRAIHTSSSEFGVDDLNLLLGGFTGNHEKLKEISGIKFQSILGLLKAC
ncbi:NAD-dependent epimerase/dehydratase family protein [Nitrosopumilus sp.]|uniref:NAD-dependent epimerase/dehydratase family protein n=1 Tax=Nitrosopumilus sp. TaxID=2024843 RepID=UPI003B5990C6